MKSKHARRNSEESVQELRNLDQGGRIHSEFLEDLKKWAAAKSVADQGEANAVAPSVEDMEDVLSEIAEPAEMVDHTDEELMDNASFRSPDRYVKR